MGEHSPGYNALMRLSKNRTYQFAEIASDWLDVVHACYVVQMKNGQDEYWDANTVTRELRQLKPGHGYFPGLSTLVDYGILQVWRQAVGVAGKTEPYYRVVDSNGVALALRELGYLRG